MSVCYDSVSWFRLGLCKYVILTLPACLSLYAGLTAVRLEHVTVVGCEITYMMGACATFVNVARSVILGCEMSHSLGAAFEHLEGMCMRPLDGPHAGLCGSEKCMLFVVTHAQCAIVQMRACVGMGKA
jgi:hypothetical protein